VVLTEKGPDCFIIGMAPTDAERMARRVCVDAVALRRGGVAVSEQSSAERNCLRAVVPPSGVGPGRPPDRIDPAQHAEPGRSALHGGEPLGQSSHMRTVAAAYCITIGIFMVAWWSVDLRRGALRRGDRAPVEIGLHLGAELASAAMLVVGGVVLLTTNASSIALIALGMLLYTVIQSPGYFIARKEIAPAAMFGALLVLTIGALLAIGVG
jgi:hypothetical protein